MDGLTRQLATFIAHLTTEQCPSDAVATAKRGAIDTIGVMLAGRDEPVVGHARSIARSIGVVSESQVLFDRGRAASSDAALVNGTAGHALDYDDVAIDGHPSVVLVPAMLAEGERLGASGDALLTAYIAGYETWGELAGRDADKHHGKGWHPTAVFGTIGAAAAAASLARLDVDRTVNALGIAASMASGLVANFGSMTKPFHAGRAAANGILAAQLAAAGMTASPDALEHRSGFLKALSPHGRMRVDGPISAGRDWYIVKNGLNIKRYPVCYALHRAIDATIELVERHKLAANDIGSIEVHLGRHQVNMLRHSRPQTGLDAKFSAEFAMAAAVVARRVGLSELTDPFVRTQAIQSMFPKVKVVSTDKDDPDDSLFGYADQVRLHTTSGMTIESAPVRYARGHARNPVSMDELRAKFADCTAQALRPAQCDQLFAQLAALERLATTRDLYSL